MSPPPPRPAGMSSRPQRAPAPISEHLIHTPSHAAAFLPLFPSPSPPSTSRDPSSDRVSVNTDPPNVPPESALARPVLPPPLRTVFSCPTSSEMFSKTPGFRFASRHRFRPPTTATVQNHGMFPPLLPFDNPLCPEGRCHNPPPDDLFVSIFGARATERGKLPQHPRQVRGTDSPECLQGVCKFAQRKKKGGDE